MNLKIRKVRSKKVAALVVAIVAAGGVVAVESPAFAATTSCELKSWSLKKKKCTTGEIKANKAHDLRISASLCKGSPYTVWDVKTGKTIASGKGKGQADNKMIDRVINGLYGTYKAKLTNGCQHDQIWLMDY